MHYTITLYRRQRIPHINRASTWVPIETRTAPNAASAAALRDELVGTEGDLLGMIQKPSYSTTDDCQQRETTQ